MMLAVKAMQRDLFCRRAVSVLERGLIEANTQAEMAVAQRRVDQVASLLVRFDDDPMEAKEASISVMEGLALGMIANLAVLRKVTLSYSLTTKVVLVFSFLSLFSPDGCMSLLFDAFDASMWVRFCFIWSALNLKMASGASVSSLR